MLFEDFDKKIKEAADQHHPAYDEKAWRKMEKLLDEHLPQQKGDRRRILFFLLAFFLLGGGAYVAISKPWKNKPASSEVVQKSQNKIQPPAAPGNTNVEQNNKTITLSTPGKTNEGNENGIVKQTPETKKANNDLSVADFSSNKKLPSSISNNNVRKNNSAGVKSDPYGNKIDHPDNNSIANKADRKNTQAIASNSTKDQPASGTNAEKKSNDADNLVGNSNSKNEEAVAKTEDQTKPDAGKQNAEPGKKETAQSKKALKSKNGFSLSVSAGPDVSKAGGSRTGKTTLVYGAGVGYTFNRVTVKTGVYFSKKIYWAGPNDYKLSYTPPSTKFEGANANCEVIEIPLKVNYAFDVKDKSNWFAGAGLSSYLMKKEKYVYKYESPASTYYHDYQTKNENKHYFSVLDLSIGYTRQINRTLSLSAEPYVEIPLTGIGVGKVRLNSGGVLFTLNVKPFAK
jgi:hypothetical protein